MDAEKGGDFHAARWASSGLSSLARGFRLSSLAGRGLRSPLPASRRRSPAASSSRCSQRVRAFVGVETVEGAGIGGRRT
jgi:hypothetical protein